MALDELNEAAALSGWDLNVGNLAEALEEGTELILGNVSGQATNEDGSVVGISELVHRLRRTVVTQRRRSAHTVHAGGSHSSTHSTRHWYTSGSTTPRFVLRSGSGDSHGTVAAVNTLHLSESSLLIRLIRKANESIAS